MAAPTTLSGIQVVKIPDGFLRHPNWVCELVLAANAPKSLTVPIDTSSQHAHFAAFAADCDFRVAYDATATIPGGDVLDGSSCELNPNHRLVLGVTTLSLISPTGGRVTIAFFTS